MKNKTDLIYEYLTENCIGKENRKKSNYFMEKYDINNNKTFRHHIEKMRFNTDEYPIRIESIAGKHGGYYVKRDNEVTTTVEKFKQRTARTAKTARALEKTPALGQLKIKLKKLFNKGRD